MMWVLYAGSNISHHKTCGPAETKTVCTRALYLLTSHCDENTTHVMHRYRSIGQGTGTSW